MYRLFLSFLGLLAIAVTVSSYSLQIIGEWTPPPDNSPPEGVAIRPADPKPLPYRLEGHENDFSFNISTPIGEYGVHFYLFMLGQNPGGAIGSSAAFPYWFSLDQNWQMNVQGGGDLCQPSISQLQLCQPVKLMLECVPLQESLKLSIVLC